LAQDSVFATRKAWLRRDRRGGAEFQTAGNLWVVEDLKRGTNKDIEPKDIFEMASSLSFEAHAVKKLIPSYFSPSG
jgi:hypothetical protein